VTERSLDDQVRYSGGPLLVRLGVARTRALELARKERPPMISNPPKWSDDWLFIDVTLRDAVASIGILDVRSKTCLFCDTACASREDLAQHLRASGCIA
jgi:hypothetical protein